MRLYSSIMVRGRGPWSEDARWKLLILGKNDNIWHQVFFNQFQLQMAFPQTAKDLGKCIIHPMSQQGLHGNLSLPLVKFSSSSCDPGITWRSSLQLLASSLLSMWLSLFVCPLFPRSSSGITTHSRPASDSCHWPLALPSKFVSGSNRFSLSAFFICSRSATCSASIRSAASNRVTKNCKRKHKRFFRFEKQRI